MESLDSCLRLFGPVCPIGCTVYSAPKAVRSQWYLIYVPGMLLLSLLSAGEYIRAVFPLSELVEQGCDERSGDRISCKGKLLGCQRANIPSTASKC